MYLLIYRRCKLYSDLPYRRLHLVIAATGGSAAAHVRTLERLAFYLTITYFVKKFLHSFKKFFFVTLQNIIMATFWYPPK